jgi:hypothetical protein
MGSPSFHPILRKRPHASPRSLFVFPVLSIVGSVEKKVKPNIFSEILSTERKSNADCFFSAILRRFFSVFSDFISFQADLTIE